MIRWMAVMAALALAAPAAAQDMSGFTTGPVFEDFGPVADIDDADFLIPEDAEFKVVLDVSAGAEGGQINRTFVSAARLINMHDRAGIEPIKNRAVVVIHGKAVFDVLSNEAWAAKGREGENASAGPIAEMIDMGVRFIVCGQSAAAYGVKRADFVPGVEMALSAMTAHALLQRDGYTVNPF